MADSSLDEFFAKKDKSKRGRSKAKYTTSDTIAKKLEEGGKKAESTPKKDIKEKTILTAVNQPLGSISLPITDQEDDEWKNIDDDDKRDYSGLKVQSLSISEKEKEDEQLKEQMADQNGDSSKSSDAQQGPWKVLAAAAAAAATATTTGPSGSPTEEEVQTPEPEVKEEPKSMTYKPPALRNVPQSTPSTGGPRRNPKSAPQITSEIHFPSLSAAVESGKGKYGETDKSFQSVKHGIRSKTETQQGLQLDLENKFSALHQGD